MARTFLLACLLAATAIGIHAQSCSDDFSQDFASKGNELQFSTFLTLVKALDINVGASAATIFAPTNDAFKAAVSALGVDADPSKWTPIQKSVVTSLLKYHLGAGVQLRTTDLQPSGASFDSMADNLPLCKSEANKLDKDNSDNFNSLTLKKEAGKTTVKAGFNSANVVTANINNTCFPQIVLHTIDAVLLPCEPSVILKGAVAAAAPSPPPKKVLPPTPKVPATKPCTLGSLQDIILKSADTNAANIGQLVSAEDFNGTVFVPTEEVFAAVRAQLLKAVGNDTNLATQLLGVVDEINKYHVVPDEVISLKTTTKPATVSTLLSTGPQIFCKPAAPGKLTIEGGDAPSVVAAGSKANIVKTIQACNGVIYTVDALLLPCDLKNSILAAAAAKLELPVGDTTTVPKGTKNTTTTVPPTKTATDPTDTDAGTGAGAGTKNGTVGATPGGTTREFVPGSIAADSSAAANKTAADVKNAKSAGYQTAMSSAGLLVAAVLALLL